MFKIDFIGIGAQKCATSWLFRCLLEHPMINGFRGKETHFFDLYYDKGIEFYAEYFDKKDKNEDSILGEFTVTYLANKKIPKRIKTHFPDVKLIVVLRNPVERAYSNYRHLQSKGLIGNLNLKDAILKYPEIKEGGMYAKYLKEFFKYFDRDKILILFYDDIKTNKVKVIKKIYSFLGVNSEFVPSLINKKYHETNLRFSYIYKKTNKIYLKLHNTFFGKKIIIFLRFLNINSLLINKLSKLENKFIKKNKKNIIINQKDTLFLFDIYKNDIKELEKMLNIDLNRWKY